MDPNAFFVKWSKSTRTEKSAANEHFLDLSEEAFVRLLQYAGALDKPPLMIASAMDRTKIRTHSTGYPTTVHKVNLKSLDTPQNLELLRRVFHDSDPRCTLS